MMSSGMLRRLALVRTDVSVEHSASFFRVTRICDLGTMLVTANIVHNLPVLVTLMKQALSFSETSVFTRATRRNIQEDAILPSHRRENLTSYTWNLFLFSDLIYCLPRHSENILPLPIEVPLIKWDDKEV
jgi:hypothetical protein